jgi:phosphoribosylformylglycinamidine synthase
MSIYRFVIKFIHADPRSAGYNSDAHALGFDNLRITCQDLYFVEGQLSIDQCRQLALQLLTDPVEQTFEFSILDESVGKVSGLSAAGDAGMVVEVALRPGVTDPVSEQIVRAAVELGFAGVLRASTGIRFLIEGAGLETVQKLAGRLLVNNIIQHWIIGHIQPSFPQEAASNGSVETILVRGVSEIDLFEISRERRAALDLAEMKAVQAYFNSIQRDPTDVEFEMIAQTWSEHCVHKTFKALIELTDERIDITSATPPAPVFINSIIKTYLKAATDTIHASWVISAFVDNAGIIDFDDEYEVSFKVETHNHPSAIEPFGGANTGVGGVIRDVIGVSAKPIANTDILCFGFLDTNPESLPDGVLHPRRIQSGVIAGVQDYGNKIGIPTVNGAILYDAGFTANPLVFCGCVGLAPKGRHIKSPSPGDRLIVLGGRTGRDGLRGATFSSMTMDAQTGVVSGASVQIGDPITEKGLIDVIMCARDRGLYTDITDCGAGGLSSAVGEMTSRIGGEVDLAKVLLKYPGLAPWEIWLSEAQERMVLALPPENVSELQVLCDAFDTELTDIGAFTGDGRIVVRFGEKIVLDLHNEFLHEGIPQRRLKALIKRRPLESGKLADLAFPDADLGNTLISLLSHPNIASKASTIRLYDHEIQGGSVVKPLTGVLGDGPSDAAVIKPAGTKGSRGIVLSNGINAEYGKRDAYQMAWAVVDEAIRNAVAVGADPQRIAILDNFCWGDPTSPETLGSLVEAVRGCHDAAIHFGTPFISGKDSLNNEYLGVDGLRHAIPPTLLISALGLIEDIHQSVTMDLKAAGNIVYLVGDFQPVFGGSHFSLLHGHLAGLVSEPQPLTSSSTDQIYPVLHQAIRAGLVCSAHDLSEGGLAVAAVEMCIGGRLGLEISLDVDEPVRSLFAETTGCLLVEVKPGQAREFENLLQGHSFFRVAIVLQEPFFSVLNHKNSLFTLPVDKLLAAWSRLP